MLTRATIFTNLKPCHPSCSKSIQISAHICNLKIMQRPQEWAKQSESQELPVSQPYAKSSREERVARNIIARGHAHAEVPVPGAAAADNKAHRIPTRDSAVSPSAGATSASCDSHPVAAISNRSSCLDLRISTPALHGQGWWDRGKGEKFLSNINKDYLFAT